MHRLFPISLLFLALILLRLGYVHGLYSPSSTSPTQSVAPRDDAANPATSLAAAPDRSTKGAPPSTRLSGPAPRMTSQAQTDTAVVTEP